MIICIIILREYLDVAVSGRRQGRPQLDALMKDLTQWQSGAEFSDDVSILAVEAS